MAFLHVVMEVRIIGQDKMQVKNKERGWGRKKRIGNVASVLTKRHSAGVATLA
jgi:hypothetical protein